MDDVNWGCEFNELELPSTKGLAQFCSYHCYTPQMEQQLKAIMKRKMEFKIIKLPDQLDEKAFKRENIEFNPYNKMGRWMADSKFTEQTVFDCRDAGQVQLRHEFHRAESMIENFNIWCDSPTILAYEDVKRQKTATAEVSNSVVY